MPHEITFKPSSTQWDKTMTQPHEPLPPFLAEPSRIGQEVSATGKWIPTKRGGRFRTSAESKEMLQEREDIHAGAKADAGVLSIEINHAVGEDAVLVHHVFKDPDALVHYFSTTATQHMRPTSSVAPSRGPSERTPSSCTCRPRTRARGATSPNRAEA